MSCFRGHLPILGCLPILLVLSMPPGSLTLAAAPPSAGSVSSATADRVVSVFAGYFSARLSETLARVIIPPPRGMSAQTALSEDLHECGLLPTVKECHACCLALPGSNNQLCGRPCGRAHAAQKAGSSEPTP